MPDFHLIFKALKSNIVGSTLVLAQIALTFAIVATASSMAMELYQKMARPTGMLVEHNIAVQSVPIDDSFDIRGSIQQDLEVLRNMANVNQVSVMSDIPLGVSAIVPIFRSETEKYGQVDVRGYLYTGDENTIDTLGSSIIAGRNFTADEINYFGRANFGTDDNMHSVLLTKEWANALFPDGDALGSDIRTSYGPMNIVGIIDVLQGAWADWEGFDRVAVFPGVLLGQRVEYLVQADSPSVRDELINEIENKLYSLSEGRVISSVKGQDELLATQYQNHSAMFVTLMIVASILVIFAVFGIYTLTKFTVSRQFKQIGIKRALGASKPYVISHYMFENILITIGGLIAGSVFILFLNGYLVRNYSVSPIDWKFVPLVALVYLLVCSLAVFAPAKKASEISPVEAIRVGT